ncbi:hypothetical protein PR003_g15171 [Phytophthora rubi]|uniref:Uncharacterized protein n=1 Tax=Phytophthora rubi TaxID=129364 RepID=A0A6A4EX80_9STRA|nr:hypothetical protein PR003_g15171 [Phytophthora rubi]
MPRLSQSFCALNATFLWPEGYGQLVRCPDCSGVQTNPNGATSARPAPIPDEGGVSAPKNSDGAPILLDAPPQLSEAAPPILK